MIDAGLHFYLSIGEPSGEQHAVSLVRSLQAQSRSLRLTGMGGDALRKSGVDTILDSSKTTVIGFVEVLRHLTEFRKQLRCCTEHILSTKPDKVILIDYPGFHLRLAAMIRKADPSIEIIQYISPKFWAWNYRRVKTMRRVFNHVLCILPFEPALLQAEGIPATFIGNPLLDQLPLDETGSSLRSELGFTPEQRVIGIFPGSRRGEISKILPVMLDAAEEMKRAENDLSFVIGAATGMTRDDLESLSGRSLDSVQVIHGRTHELMAASQLLLAKSGTTTLEGALFGIPMVVPYRSSWISAFLAKALLRTKHFSLPNILLCDFPMPGSSSIRPSVVPELLQGEATPVRICKEALAILRHPERSFRIRQELLELNEVLGGRGASERAALFLLNPQV